MKVDNEGLTFFNEDSKGKELYFTDAPKKVSLAKGNVFYELLDNPNYLIKYSLDHLDDEKTRIMLRKFINLQSKIHQIDFPTSYYVQNNKMSGTIIPYYQGCPSLYTIAETHSLEELMKYYVHDDDYIHNLFMLLNDILNLMEILVENNICYTDNHSGNFVFYNNEVKLIDFDYNYLYFDQDKEHVKKVLTGFDELVFILNRRFELIDLCYYKVKGFDKMRKHLVKVENKVRKRLYV